MENLEGTASAGGETDEDDVLTFEFDFTQTLRDYWESKKKEEQE